MAWFALFQLPVTPERLESVREASKFVYLRICPAGTDGDGVSYSPARPEPRTEEGRHGECNYIPTWFARRGRLGSLGDSRAWSYNQGHGEYAPYGN